jgi:hypothetical protein
MPGAGGDLSIYDLESDAHERNNLVGDPSLADVRKQLAATLKRRMVAAGEKEPVISPEIKALCRLLPRACYLEALLVRGEWESASAVSNGVGRRTVPMVGSVIARGP